MSKYSIVNTHSPVGTTVMRVITDPRPYGRFQQKTKKVIPKVAFESDRRDESDVTEVIV